MAVNPPPTPPPGPAGAPAPAPPPSDPPAASGGFWTGFTARTAVFDIAGLSFVGSAIYVGIVHGVQAPEFGVFAALAGAYLGLKSGT